MIPSIPNYNEPWVLYDQQKKTYRNNPVWYGAFSQLLRHMQSNLSGEGVVMPAQNSTNINLLNQSSPGTFLYDSTNNVSKLTNDGANFKEIYTRPEQLTSAQIAAIPSAQINGTWAFDTDTNELKYGINTAFHVVPYT